MFRVNNLCYNITMFLVTDFDVILLLFLKYAL